MKKRALVLDAFAEASIAGYTFDLTADELQTGLQRLEQMIGDWAMRGLLFGFNLQGMATADLDDEAFLPVPAGEPDTPHLYEALIVMNLAKSIAGAFGKQCAPSTIEAARRTFRNFLAAHASVQPKATGRDSGTLSSTQRLTW